MNRTSTLATLLLSACASDGTRPAAPGPGGPASGPAPTVTGTPADRTALAMRAAVGDPYAASEIRFDFVVVDDGVEKFRRRHVWRPEEGTDAVTVGDRTTVVADLKTHAPRPASEDPAEKAYAAWVNDTFWLVAPAKVLDPGVSRTLDDDGRLTVRFDGVGLTPGDLYTYTVDPETSRVTRWDFTLESGTQGSFRWEAYQAFGPLTLSTRRPSVDGAREIRFERVVVVPPSRGL